MRGRTRFYKGVHVKINKTGQFGRVVSGKGGKVFVEILDPHSFMCNQAIVPQKSAGRHLIPFPDMTLEDQGQLHRIAESRKRSVHARGEDH